MVADFENKKHTNYLRGSWVKYNDAFVGGKSTIIYSLSKSPGFNESKNCVYIKWTLNPEIDWPITGIFLDITEFKSRTQLNSYYGVKFFAKGRGSFLLKFQTDATIDEGNGYETEIFVLTPEWKLYEIPYSSLLQTWGTPCEWDSATIRTIEWHYNKEISMSGEMYIDDIAFYRVEEKKEIIAQKEISEISGKTIAVVGLNSQITDDNINNTIIDFLINAFVNVNIVNVVDRQSIDIIMQEQELQMQDFMDTDKATKIGKLAGAEIVVICSLRKIDQIFYLNIKLISVETLQIIGSSIVSADTESDFLKMCNEGVSNLF